MESDLSVLFQSEWFRQSILGTLLIGLNFALLGVTLVEKRLSLVGDTFSHAILPGVVIGSVLGGSSSLFLLLGGWLAGILLLSLTYFISKKNRAHQESTFAFMAVFFVAIGMIISFKTQKSSEILHLLLGSILAFDGDLFQITWVVTALTWLTFLFSRRLWSMWILDPDSLFYPHYWISTLRFLGIFLLVTNLILGLYALGALMSVGLLVIPSLTSQIYCVRLYNRVGLTALIACTSSVVGFAASYYWDWPLGPSLVLVAGLIYLTSLLFQSLFFRKALFA